MHPRHSPQLLPPRLLPPSLLPFRLLRRFGPRHLILVAALAVILVAALAVPLPGHAAPAPAQQTYATPDDAAAALVAAVRAHDQAALHAVFGAGSDSVIDSGDKYADEESQRRFAAAFDTRHQWVSDNGRMVLHVGDNDWPVPIPLVQDNGRWRFDTQAGAQEIIDRRIGNNELKTIRTLLAYVQAQQDYFDLAKQHSGTGVYARHLVSNPGKHDGLYWPAEEGQDESPLGPLVAAAVDDGYPGEVERGHVIPYNGYFFRILKAQGPEAADGARAYVRNGKMTGGYAMIAWPASYGVSGVMTFEVNQDGVVYQKDLGPHSAQLAAAVGKFDPDPDWAVITLSDD